MIKDLIIFFFTLDHMDYVLFVPTLCISFLAGIISLLKGVGRWT